MVIVTDESCDSVLVGTGKQQGLESAANEQLTVDITPNFPQYC